MKNKEIELTHQYGNINPFIIKENLCRGNLGFLMKLDFKNPESNFDRSRVNKFYY